MVPKDLDEKIINATVAMLKARNSYYNDHVYAGPRGVYGLAFRCSDGRQSVTGSGGVTLYHASPTWKIPFMGLDLTHGDVPDGVIQDFRRNITWALEQNGVQFLPASRQALRRIGDFNMFMGAVEFIDRDDLQCVFSYKGKHYISGYDANETPPLYFLAELPRKPESYKDAIESLKPESVKLAEEMGLSVMRQGDMFFIPTPYKTNDLKKMDAVFDTMVQYESKIQICTPREVKQAIETGILTIDSMGTRVAHQFMHVVGSGVRPGWMWTDGRLYAIDDDGFITVKVNHKRGFYGTAHTATEVAYLPDGTMFARDTVMHDPRGVRLEGRPADHHHLKLPGKKWYLVAKNTVPVVVPQHRFGIGRR